MKYKVVLLNIIIELVINTSGRTVINFEHDSVVGSENTSISISNISTMSQTLEKVKWFIIYTK